MCVFGKRYLHSPMHEISMWNFKRGMAFFIPEKQKTSLRLKRKTSSGDTSSGKIQLTKLT